MSGTSIRRIEQALLKAVRTPARSVDLQAVVPAINSLSFGDVTFLIGYYGIKVDGPGIPQALHERVIERCRAMLNEEAV